MTTDLPDFVPGRGETLTALSVARRLQELSRALSAAVDRMAEEDEQVARAKHAYEVGFARVMLHSDERSADKRKAAAVLAMDDQYLHLLVAETRLRATRELVRSLTMRIEIGRSLGAAVRSEAALAGYAPS